MTAPMQHLLVWTVCRVYRLTRNAANMWQWKQSFNCFVWGQRKTRKLNGLQKYTHMHTQLSCLRPATHHSQQGYLVTPGNDNVCYSCWSFRSEETAVLLLNNFWYRKVGKVTYIPLCSGCRLGAVIIIQHLCFLQMTEGLSSDPRKYNHPHKYVSVLQAKRIKRKKRGEKKNLTGWFKPQRTELENHGFSG